MVPYRTSFSRSTLFIHVANEDETRARGPRAEVRLLRVPRRSAFIVLCCRGLSYAGKTRPFSEATWNAWATSNDTFPEMIGYPGGAPQLLWEANHNDDVPYPSAAQRTVARLTQWTRALDLTYDFLNHERA
jgi:hypothetical protein